MHVTPLGHGVTVALSDGICATAFHVTADGGSGMIQVTVHVPFFETSAWGETNHGWLPLLACGTFAAVVESLPITKIAASLGRFRSVPFHVYRRLGGGEDGCSDRPVIAMRGRFPDDDDSIRLGVGCGDPSDWPLGRFTSATMMLATAATTAPSSTCQRSKRRHRLLRARVPMERILACVLQCCPVRSW